MACSPGLGIGLVILWIATLCTIVATFTNYWTQYRVRYERITYSAGLYRICVDNEITNSYECNTYKPSDFVKTTRTLTGFAVGLSCLASVFGLVHAIMVQRGAARRQVTYAIGIAGVLAAICMGAACGYFSNKYRDDDQALIKPGLGLSFYLAIGSVIGLCLGSGLIVFSYQPYQSHGAIRRDGVVMGQTNPGCQINVTNVAPGQPMGYTGVTHVPPVQPMGYTGVTHVPPVQPMGYTGVTHVPPVQPMDQTGFTNVPPAKGAQVPPYYPGQQMPPPY